MIESIVTVWRVLYEEFGQGSWLEFIAFILAVGYLVLATQKQRLCWVAGGLGTALYAWVFWQSQLYLESLLNVFYAAMSVYGWHQWSQNRNPSGELTIVVWPVRLHLISIGSLACITFGLGWAMARWTDAALPYIDAFTTCFAIFATFLTARKVLENWLYWMVINAVAAVMFTWRELYYTVALMVVYEVLGIVGLWTWWQSYRRLR